MESFPYFKAHNRCDCQCGYCESDHAVKSGHKTNGNEQLSATECTVESKDSGSHYPACSKCLQRRSKESSEVHGADLVIECGCEVYELKNCRQIVDYLETGKDDNYFEEFLLPEKVLSKFVLLLGECMSHLRFVFL